MGAGELVAERLTGNFMRGLWLLAFLCVMPSQAYACAGKSSLAQNAYLYLVLFTPAFLVVYLLKTLLCCHLARKPVSAQMWKAGFAPLAVGIILGTVFFYMYSDASELRSAVYFGSIPPMAALLYAAFKLSEHKLSFAAEAGLINGGQIVVNVISSLFLSLWIVLAGGSIQCSGSESISNGGLQVKTGSQVPSTAK